MMVVVMVVMHDHHVVVMMVIVMMMMPDLHGNLGDFVGRLRGAPRVFSLQ